MLSNCAGEDLDSKEIKSVNPKGKQPWIFIGRTDAEAETPNTLTTWCEELIHWKWPWCWERLKAEGKGDDRGWDSWIYLIDRSYRYRNIYLIDSWQHWLNGHEFEQTLGDNDGQESLVCCSSWDHKESDMTEWLNNNSKTWCRKIRSSPLSQRLEHRWAAFTLQHEKEFSWTFLGFCVSKMRISSSHFMVTSNICS